MIFENSKSKTLASMIAREFNGKIEDYQASFGPFKTCKFRVKIEYNNMKIETYIFYPYFEIWIQNFNINTNVLFSINKANDYIGLNLQCKNVFQNSRLTVFTNRAYDIDGLSNFCKKFDNEKDIRNLIMKKDESLTISSSQIVMRNKTDDLELIRKRFITLNSLFNRNSIRKNYVFSKVSYKISIGSIIDQIEINKKKIFHYFGGVPEHNPPLCVTCNSPLHLLAKIDTMDPILKLKSIGERFMFVMSCLNCDSNTQPLYIDYTGGFLLILHQEKGLSFKDFPEIFEKREITISRFEPKDRITESNELKHKIGGTPAWIQSEEVPVCMKCGKHMKFIAQIGTDHNIGIQFGDEGILYAFICVKCKLIATFIQSL